MKLFLLFILLWLLPNSSHSQNEPTNIENIKILYTKDIQVSAEWHTEPWIRRTYTDKQTILMLSMKILDTTSILPNQRFCIYSTDYKKVGNMVQIDSIKKFSYTKIFNYYFSLMRPPKGWIDIYLVNPNKISSSDRDSWSRPASNKKRIYIEP